MAHCERERKEAGEHVRADVAEALALVLRFPALGRSGEGGLRRIVTNRCHYILHYEVAAEQIVVWAVADPAREPGYWRPRLRS